MNKKKWWTHFLFLILSFFFPSDSESQESWAENQIQFMSFVFYISPFSPFSLFFCTSLPSVLCICLHLSFPLSLFPPTGWTRYSKFWTQYLYLFLYSYWSISSASDSRHNFSNLSQTKWRTCLHFMSPWIFMILPRKWFARICGLFSVSASRSHLTTLMSPFLLQDNCILFWNVYLSGGRSRCSF